MNHQILPARLPRLAAAVVLALAASAAGATDLYLKAHRAEIVLPLAGNATTQVPMWTYSRCDSDFATNCVSLFDGGGKAGPLLTVPEGALTIHLRNELDEPTSVFMPGQPKLLNPVRTGDRITSFDAETAPGTTGVYSWSAPRRGTFLLQSGTHPQKQVHMGLHGVLRVGDPVLPAGEAVAQERTLVFSEIDPDLHGDGTSDGTFAANAAVAIRPVPAGERPQGYAPKFFLINGKPYTAGSTLDGMLENIAAGQGVVLNLVNAGLETHAPELVGGEFEVTAEDGYAAPTRRLRSSTVLPAGKTLAVLFKPTRDDTYTLLDRRLRLVSGSRGDSGMLAKLKVGAGMDGDGGSVVPDSMRWLQPLAVNDLFLVNEGGQTIPPTGVLANDQARSNNGVGVVPLLAERDSSVAPAYGSVTLNADGSFRYTPTNPKAFTVDSRAGLPASCTNAVVGRDAFQYYAVDSQAQVGGQALRSATPARVEVELKQVNDAPTTVGPDFYYSSSNNGAISVLASGFLANDMNADIDCDVLLRASDLGPYLAGGGPYVNATKTAGLFNFTTHGDGTGTGGFTASVNTPNALGVSRFAYRAADLGGLKGAVGTVYAVRDALVEVDLVNDTLSGTSYKRATVATANRWTIRMAGRPITVAGFPKTYKLTFYAVFNGVTTLIGSKLHTLQGTPAARTMTFATPLLTDVGGIALPEHARVGLKVVVDVPADGTVPAHSITLNTDIPVL